MGFNSGFKGLTYPAGSANSFYFTFSFAFPAFDWRDVSFLPPVFFFYPAEPSFSWFYFRHTDIISPTLLICFVTTRDQCDLLRLPKGFDIVCYSILCLSINTNKMQLCNRIYYCKVYWRVNMFRAAHRSSSLPFPTQPWQRPVTTWAYKPEAASTV